MWFRQNFWKVDHFCDFQQIWEISWKWPVHPYMKKGPKKNSWHNCEHHSFHNYVNCWQVFIDIKNRLQNIRVEYKELLQGYQYKKVNEPHQKNLYKIKKLRKNPKVNSNRTPPRLSLKKIKDYQSLNSSNANLIKKGLVTNVTNLRTEA